ncbi:MAG: PH domain-containing protein [Candidatus Altiarchaeota archaeon]|nr:PH domain-containing protein [Candidatus Altiarchaeota archaeon]
MLNEEGVRNYASFENTASVAFVLSWIFILFFLSLVISLILLALGVNPVIMILLFLLLLIILYLYAREFFKTFLFELRGDYFFSKKGVITPSYTIIPYENIQDVHINQGILEKMLGLSTVRVYTATFSGRGSDMIPGLSWKNAEAFKDSLFKKMKEVKQVVD